MAQNGTVGNVNKMRTIQLKATNARDARFEAKSIAPCRLKGYDQKGECVYLSCVRAPGHKAPVATATKGNKLAVSFLAELDEI